MMKLKFFNDKLYVFLILVGIISFFIFLIYIWNLTVDDAYISFRYALHLAEGYGLVWNIGEQPIEGYSNFLWVLILSVFLYLKLDPVIISKLIGLSSVIGILFYYWKFMDDIFSGKRKVVLLGFGIAVLLFLVNPATAIHTISGLETMFYSFLMIGLTYYSYRIINSPNKAYYWLFGVFALLLSLLRFEGILITISLILLFVLLNYKEYNSFKLKKSFIIPVISLFVIPVVLYMIFRYQYFHDIFPITYHAKALSGNIFSRAIYNINWIYKYTLKHILPFILVNLVVIIFYKLFLPNLQIRKNYFKIIITFLFVAIAGNIIYFSTELAMNYGDRLFYPSYIILYLITAISLTLIYINKDLYEFKPLKKIRFSKNSLLFVLIILLIFTNFGYMSSLTGWHDYGNKVHNTQVSVGLALEPFSAYNYTVATDYAGAIPYYSGWRHIDMLGLNDKYIAENKKPSLDYLRQVKPDLIILPYKPNGELTNEDFYPFLEYAKENNYTEIKLPWDNFTYYLNPKIEHFNEINQSLNKIKYVNIMYDFPFYK